MKSRPAYQIKARSDVMTFGQYKDRTVEWVLEKHPEYIVWLHEEKICEIPSDILVEAEEADNWNYIDWCEVTGFSIWDVIGDDD